MKWRAAFLVCLLIGCASPVANNSPFSAEKPTPIATLDNSAGMVLVNDKSSMTGTLNVGDTVKTGPASTAEIHFYDTAVIRLAENTEVTIKDVGSDAERTLSLSQTSGQTWSRLLKLGGVTHYEVETSTLTASVRGTGFMVTVTDDDTDVAVGEGTVEVMTKSPLRERQLVKRLQHAKVSRAMKMEMRDMVSDRLMDDNLAKDEKFIDKMADRFAAKHPRVVRALKNQGYTDDDMHVWMRHLATGNMSREQLKNLASDAMQELKESRIVNSQGEMSSDNLPVQ